MHASITFIKKWIQFSLAQNLQDLYLTYNIPTWKETKKLDRFEALWGALKPDTINPKNIKDS